MLPNCSYFCIILYHTTRTYITQFVWSKEHLTNDLSEGLTSFLSPIAHNKTELVFVACLLLIIFVRFRFFLLLFFFLSPLSRSLSDCVLVALLLLFSFSQYSEHEI